MLTLNYLCRFYYGDNNESKELYQCPKCGECYDTPEVSQCSLCGSTDEDLITFKVK